MSPKRFTACQLCRRPSVASFLPGFDRFVTSTASGIATRLDSPAGRRRGELSLRADWWSPFLSTFAGANGNRTLVPDYLNFQTGFRYKALHSSPTFGRQSDTLYMRSFLEYLRATVPAEESASATATTDASRLSDSLRWPARWSRADRESGPLSNRERHRRVTVSPRHRPSASRPGTDRSRFSVGRKLVQRPSHLSWTKRQKRHCR